MLASKKGVAEWISYVMLTALAVSLGALVLHWSRSTTEETVDDIVARGDALTLCEASGIDVSGLCQNTQTLNMEVTNTKDVKIESIQARMFDIYKRPQTASRNITILPQQTKSLQILKDGILKKAEIMPVVKKDSKRIVCQSRALSFDDVPVC